mgnify:CR=1 FL=1
MSNQQIFFDRIQILDTLQKRLTGLKEGYRQNIALIGNPLMGKTSILKRFLAGISDEQIVAVYLEFGSADFKSFMLRFLGSILYSYLKKDQTPIKEDLDFLIESSNKYIPKTTAKLLQIKLLLEKGRRNSNIFSETLGLFETLHQETGKLSLVIFDEFQLLEEFGIKDIFRELGKKIMIQKKSMYLFSSSAKYKAKKILSKELALLFGNFEMIEVGAFNLNACHEFIQEKIQGINMPSSIADFIINFTGGCPFYLDLICLKARQEANSRHEDLISQVTIIKVLEDLLFDAYGELNQRYSRLLSNLVIENNNDTELISILECLSNNCNKLKEICQYLHKKESNLLKKLNRLIELEIVDKNGIFYQINDRVFNFWLKFVYQLKQEALDYNLWLQINSFRKQIEGLINDFILISKKDIVERVEELFNLFKDDSVLLEKYRLKLNRFCEIKPLRFECNHIKKGIAGLTKNSLWLAAVIEDRITENDIAEFANECKKYRHKLQKRIIIAFEEIDINAYLLAKENHILTWNIENLNSLLDLYGKPRIVGFKKNEDWCNI